MSENQQISSPPNETRAQTSTNDVWVRRARPSIIFVAVLIMLVQYAVLPIYSMIAGRPHEYMPEFAVVAVLVPVVTFVLARTFEKIKGVAS